MVTSIFLLPTFLFSAQFRVQFRQLSLYLVQGSVQTAFTVLSLGFSLDSFHRTQFRVQFRQLSLYLVQGSVQTAFTVLSLGFSLDSFHVLSLGFSLDSYHLLSLGFSLDSFHCTQFRVQFRQLSLYLIQGSVQTAFTVLGSQKKYMI